MRTSSSEPPPPDATARRWQRRPGWALTVRLVVILTPLTASIVAGIAASRTFRPVGGLAVLGWLLWVALVSLAVLGLVDVAVRRLLPLQRLLQLCLVFPDKAPSRLRLAARAARPRRPEALIDARAVPADASQAATHIVGLLGALSVHDRRTRGHSERVCAYTELLADQMHLEQDDRDRLMWVALVHDIGKLEVPRGILNKPGRPTVDEWRTLQKHPSHGADLIAPLAEWFGSWSQAVLHHHERYDGTGYPQGLTGDQISLGGRILAVTDAFEVMTAPRPYRRPVDAQAARAELARQAGTHFDPTVVRHFLAIGLPELRRSMGALSWLGQLPFIRDWPRLQSTSAAATTQAATAVASTAGVVALSAGAIVPATASESAASGHHSPEAAVAGHATSLEVAADQPTDMVASDHHHPAATSADPAPRVRRLLRRTRQQSGAEGHGRHHSHHRSAGSPAASSGTHTATPAGGHGWDGHSGAPTAFAPTKPGSSTSSAPRSNHPASATTAGDQSLQGQSEGLHLGWRRGPSRRSAEGNEHARGPRPHGR